VIAGFDEFAIKTRPMRLQWTRSGSRILRGRRRRASSGGGEVQPAHNYSGPYTAPTRTAVTLDKATRLQDVRQSAVAGAQQSAGCAWLRAYQVSATLVGGWTAWPTRRFNGQERQGDGIRWVWEHERLPARLVLESVSDITPKEVDYTKSDLAPRRCAAVCGNGELIDRSTQRGGRPQPWEQPAANS